MKLSGRIMKKNRYTTGAVILVVMSLGIPKKKSQILGKKLEWWYAESISYSLYVYFFIQEISNFLFLRSAVGKDENLSQSCGNDWHFFAFELVKYSNF